MTNCTSCGKPFTEHLGIIGTCAEVQRLRTALNELWNLQTFEFSTMPKSVMEEIHKQTRAVINDAIKPVNQA